MASVLSPPLNPAPTTMAAGDVEAILAQGAVPAGTETLLGDPRQRVNVVVEAGDAAGLQAAMRAAGWTLAPRPGPVALSRALLADWTGRAAPRPLVVPTFWDGRPNELGFEAGTAREEGRLHARFWRAAARPQDGATVFVGTVTREDPLDWAVGEEPPPPSADPDARVLAASLRQAGLRADIVPSGI